MMCNYCQQEFTQEDKDNCEIVTTGNEVYWHRKCHLKWLEEPEKKEGEIKND